MAAQHHFARCRRILVGMHRVAAVGLEIEYCGRAGDDERVESTVDDRDVDRADARQIVAADGREQCLAVAAGVDEPATFRRDLRRRGGEVIPAGHHLSCTCCTTSPLTRWSAR